MKSYSMPDQVFEALAAPYRRQLLIALVDHNPQDDRDNDPLNVVDDDREPKMREIEMIHSHLPKLEEMGYIRWNQDTSEISKGPKWDEIEPLLTLIHDHQDELPDEWL